MGGKRLDSFRSGDRSEYMALFGLSRFAFVSPIPRQEDFGVDFLCVLSRREDKFDYPESAFYVQVKAAKKDLLVDTDSIRWITHHMDHPLFLCIADKTSSELTFYSLSRIWLALFLCSEPKSISLKPDQNDNPSEPCVLRKERGESHFDLMLGPPILSQDLGALEKDPSVAYNILKAWIQMDAANIARRRMGRLFFQCFWDWQTNVTPQERYLNRYFSGPDYGGAERELASLLTALGFNYIDDRQREKLEALRAMLRLLGPLLDEWGQKIIDRSFDIPEEHKPGDVAK